MQSNSAASELGGLANGRVIQFLVYLAALQWGFRINISQLKHDITFWPCGGNFLVRRLICTYGPGPWHLIHIHAFSTRLFFFLFLTSFLHTFSVHSVGEPSVLAGISEQEVTLTGPAYLMHIRKKLFCCKRSRFQGCLIEAGPSSYVFLLARVF